MNFKPDDLVFPFADSGEGSFLPSISPLVSAGETALRLLSAPGQAVPFP
jgi:hypothetical protein